MDQEPLRRNIDGSISEEHIFEHEVSHTINWGYVAVGVGLLVVAYVGYRALDTDNDDDRSTEPTIQADSSGEIGG